MVHFSSAALDAFDAKSLIFMNHDTKFARVRSTLKDAANVRTLWAKIPDFRMGDVSLEDFTAVYNSTDVLDKAYVAKDIELTGIREDRDDKARELGSFVKRFKGGVLSTFGSDSTEYAQLGLVRDSARKTPRRKAKPVQKDTVKAQTTVVSAKA
jgi:hypothetical protein